MPRRYTVSDKVREANRAKSKKPRSAWAGTEEGERQAECKRLLAQGLPDGAQLVLDTIRDPSVPLELRLQAFKLAADRAGVPTMTQQDVSVTASGGREVWASGLGWPEATGETVADRDHDDRRDEQPSIQ